MKAVDTTIVILLILAAGLAQPALGAVIYVDADATGNDDGTSWTDAYNYLQDALGGASSGDEIWVAEATYKPTDGNDTTVSFDLVSGVGVYGGFDATESARSQRDWRSNVTTLSGDIDDDGVPDGDNSLYVVHANDYNVAAVLDGFTVTMSGYNGAAIYCDAASITVGNCLVENNANDGMQCYDHSEIGVRNTTIQDNAGDAFDLYSVSTAVIENSLVHHNGGNGILVRSADSEPNLVNNTVADNQVCGIWTSNPNLNIVNCVVWGNGYSFYPTGTYSVTYSCIEDCNYVGNPNVTHNTCSDPCFVGGPNDPNNYHLASKASPCYNSGDPNRDYSGQKDIDGEPRVMNQRVDMGGDELRGPWYVNGENGNDNNDGLSWLTAFATIAKGLASADDNEIVEVNEATYYEDIDFNGVGCTLTSVDPNDPCVVAETIIDANDFGVDVVTFENAEDTSTILRGFTITGGKRGIYCEGASPTIRQCVVTGNGVESILAHWGLDDDANSTTVADSSGNGHTGTASQNTSLFHTDTCKAGTGAFVFDGDDYVSLGSNSALKIPYPLALSAWVKLGSDFTGSKGVVCLGSWGSNYYGVHLAVSSGEQVFIQFGDGVGGSSSHRRGKLGSTSLSQDTWYHIAGVIKSPTAMTIYVNGEDDGGSYIGSYSGSISYGNGSSVIGNRPSSCYFDGTIDDVMVFDRALSAGEADSLSDMGRVGIGGGLAHWKMDDDANSTTVTDSSGNGNNGTASKNTSLLHTDTYKVGTGAFELDGSSDYVNIGNNVKPSLPISVSMWIEPNSLGSNQWLFENDRYTATDYYGIWAYIKTTNAISIAYGDGGSPGPTSRRSKASTSTVSSGEWQHIAFVLRGAADMDIYIDGTNAGGTYGGTGGTLAYSSADGSIGSHGGSSYFFDGTIDEVMVFDRALSEDEIDALVGIGGGGVCCADSASPSIANCTFNSNSAIYGAGICSIDSSPVITNCAFSENVASVDGGAVFDQNSNSTLTNAVLANNLALSSGGGMFNCDSDPIVINSIMWGDDPNEIDNDNSDPNFSYCDIQGCGGSGGGWCANFGTDGGGNIDNDPNFLDPNDPDGSDDTFMTSDDGLSIESGSPCIDAANGNVDPAKDIVDNSRYDDPNTSNTGIGDPNYVDMGAYEYNPN